MSQFYHYVYRLESTSGEFYFGSRTTSRVPENDSYMGSGRWPLDCKRNGVKLSKAIVAAGFFKRSAASEHEVQMIRAHQGNRLCMNLSSAVQVPAMGHREYVNRWASFLESGITACGSLAACLYIEVIGLGQGKGISNYVLSKRAGRDIDECDNALSLVSSLGEIGIPQIEKIGNIWKIKSI